MKIFYLVLLSVIMFSACASIDQSLLLKKQTTVEVRDVSKEIVISGSIKENTEIAKRIIEGTIDELSRRSIEVVAENTPGAAKVKYNIRNVSKGFFRYTVKYEVTLETPDGKIIFTDSDEMDESDIDEVYGMIARKTASLVSKSFK